MPAAIWLVWLRRTGRVGTLRAVRLGLLAAIPLTAIGGWLFQSSPYQARWESIMAIVVIGLALACGRRAWRPVLDVRLDDRLSTLWQIATAAAGALIVVRQTMLMAVVF